MLSYSRPSLMLSQVETEEKQAEGVGAGPTAQYPAPADMQRDGQQFNIPPSNGNPRHSVGQNFFWRYFTVELQALEGPAYPQQHGEIQEWALGKNRAEAEMAWQCCFCCWPCMIEADRKAIEAKIHEFHVARNDPSAPPAAFAHQGLCCLAIFAVMPMAAQNYSVMKNFQRTQVKYLRGNP